MVRSERGESPPENFPQNRWILVNLAHAGRNLVHITFTNEFLWIRHKALSCGPFPTVFDFSFVIPTNQISSHPPQLQVFRRQFLKFLLFFASSRHHWIMKNAPAFLLRKISLISCHHHFLCVDLWPKPGMFSTRQTCVLPKANPCFANAQGNVLPPSIWQCSSYWVLPFCPAAHQIKPVVGPSSSCPVPAESVIWGIAPDLDNQPPSVTVF